MDGSGSAGQELSLEAATRQAAAKCHVHLAQILVRRPHATLGLPSKGTEGLVPSLGRKKFLMKEAELLNAATGAGC